MTALESRTSDRTGLRRAATVAVALLMVTVAVVAALAVTGRLGGGVRCEPPPAATPCLRVLFIGNSYTYVNDLPATFAELARGGGHPVETGMEATGGATLADHVAGTTTAELLRSARWDTVVLQEQSEIPSVERLRVAAMDPAARTLVGRVQASGADPMFLVTWAHRDGWPENGLLGYGRMQDALDAGYATIAAELGVPLAPVGQAWATVRSVDPGLDLWDVEGIHPSPAGTYLAASVLYAAMFRESSEASTFTAGLPSEVARLLGKEAARTVLADPSRWGLR